MPDVSPAPRCRSERTWKSTANYRCGVLIIRASAADIGDLQRGSPTKGEILMSIERPHWAFRTLVTWITSSGLRFCILMWLGQRLLIQGLGSLLVAVFGVPTRSRGGVLTTFFHWDSGFFACIAERGYFGPACDSGATFQRLAFFPAYPMLSRSVAWVVGRGTATASNITAGMWTVSAVASLFAVVALYYLARLGGGPAMAQRSVAFLLFWPYSLFLVASYSESLYLAAAITAWFFCQRQRYVSCAFAGIVATATRANGIFLVPALLILYVTSARRDGRQLRVRELVLVASSSLGVLGYWGWLAYRTGVPLAWSNAQSDGWNRHTQWPWWTLMQQMIHVLRDPRWDWRVQSVLELLFAVGVCLALLMLLKRREWAALTLVGLTAVSLMTSNTYLSLGRNTLAMFPLYLLLGQVSTEGRRPHLRFGVMLAISATLMIFNTMQFALGRWAD